MKQFYKQFTSFLNGLFLGIVIGAVGMLNNLEKEFDSVWVKKEKDYGKRD